MKRNLIIALGLMCSLASFVNAAAPKVVMTSPDNGEDDVSAEVTEIRVEFDQAMDTRGRSIVGGGESFPMLSGQPKWVDARTMVIPVTLKPEHSYWLSINSDTFKGFRGKNGEPAEWYPVQFKTRGAGAAGAESDVTAEQNQAAVAALKKAIDEDYAYRDRKKVDWGKEIEKRQGKLEQAKTANEFARLTAHLLRLAEDAHVSVQAGDVRIGTRSNSSSPNVNIEVLRKAVGGWTEHASGIITGQLENGIGYILFSSCSKEQAEGFDKALDEMKDTKALIVDARLNGGGDEIAAQRVAGRFVEKATVYSKDRIREGGKWTAAMDRVVKAREGAEPYAKPVAVLVGPKIVSSAESFVLMMKHGAKAKLIGEATKGSSGRPIAHQLGNGVTVYLSSWEDQLPDGTVLEGRGVRPDVVVKMGVGKAGESDAVLEAALMALKRAK
jgi:hypothetical protein